MPFRPTTASQISAPAAGQLSAGSVADQLAELAGAVGAVTVADVPANTPADGTPAALSPAFTVPPGYSLVECYLEIGTTLGGNLSGITWSPDTSGAGVTEYGTGVRVLVHNPTSADVDVDHTLAVTSDAPGDELDPGTARITVVPCGAP